MLIDEEVRRTLDEAYGRAREILTRRRDELERVAQELIHQESLDRSELDRLLATAPEEQSAEVRAD